MRKEMSSIKMGEEKGEGKKSRRERWKMFPIFLLISFFLASALSTSAQLNLDSLSSVYNDPLKADSIRSQAFYQFIQQGWMRRDPNTAFVYAEQYLAFAEHKGLVGAEADALFLMGNSLRLRSNFKAALKYYERSLVLREDMQDYGTMYASTLNNIGNVHVKTGEYELALNYYQMSADAAQSTHDKGKLASALNNIGNIHNIQGNCIQAIEYYDQSLKLKEATGDKLGMGSSLNNIGNVYNRQGYPEKAITYYEESLKVREQINDFRGQASSLLNLGRIVASHLRDYETALVYLERSRLIREEIADKKGLVDTFNGLGEVYIYLEQNQRAMGYFNRSLDLLQKIDFKLGLSRTLFGMGDAYAGSNNYTKAIHFHKRSLEIANSIGARKEIMNASEALFHDYEHTDQHEMALKMLKLFMDSKDSIANLKSQRRIIQYEYEQQALADSVKNADAIRLQQILVDNEIEKNKRKQQQAYLLYGGIFLLFVLTTILYNRFRVATFRKKVIERQKTMAEETNRELLEKNQMIQAQADEIKVINKRIRSINQSLERRVKERTRKIELQHERLRKYAFSNSHVVRAPLSRLMGLISLWDEENVTIEERALIANLISISAHELDDVVRNLNEELNGEEKKSA